MGKGAGEFAWDPWTSEVVSAKLFTRSKSHSGIERLDPVPLGGAMNSKPLVSVIIPFLNVEKFIQEAVESVFAQTYDYWELLLVDDGSIDKSTEIAQWYSDRYPGRVHYLEHDSHRNRGASTSRNLGFSRAKGEYIAFLDADDVWFPHKLEQQLAILGSQPGTGVVYGATEYWYSWTRNPADTQRDYVWRRFGVQPNTIVNPPDLLVLFLRHRYAVPCTGSFLLRRGAVERVGGYEESFRYIYTDQAFLVKLCLTTSFFVADGCWDRYRQHPDSCCHVAEQKGQIGAAYLIYLRWLEQYLSEQGVKNIAVWSALGKARWSYRHPLLSGLLDRARKLFSPKYA